MKRSVFALLILSPLSLLVGCGGSSKPAADYSDQPSEVQQYEAKRDAEIAKRAAKQAGAK